MQKWLMLHFAFAGLGHGEGCGGGEVSGVLGADAERPQDGLRRGYPGCALSCANENTKKEVRDFVNSYLVTPICSRFSLIIQMPEENNYLDEDKKCISH